MNVDLFKIRLNVLRRIILKLIFSIVILNQISIEGLLKVSFVS